MAKYQLAIKEGDSVIAELEIKDSSQRSLIDAQIQDLGKLTEIIMQKIYPGLFLPAGDAQMRSLQSRNLLYSLIFFLDERGCISKKHPLLRDPNNRSFKALGRGFSALLDVTINLYKTCEIAGALDILPYDCAYDHWLAFITEVAMTEFCNFRSSAGKTAAAQTVRRSKEELEKLFPNKKRRKLKRIQENIKTPFKNPFDPTQEPVAHQWLELIIHVGTWNPSEKHSLRNPKKEIRMSFNKWVATIGEWQRVLTEPEYNVVFCYSNGISLEEVKPRRSKSLKKSIPNLTPELLEAT